MENDTFVIIAECANHSPDSRNSDVLLAPALLLLAARQSFSRLRNAAKTWSSKMRNNKTGSLPSICIINSYHLGMVPSPIASPFSNASTTSGREGSIRKVIAMAISFRVYKSDALVFGQPSSQCSSSCCSILTARMSLDSILFPPCPPPPRCLTSGGAQIHHVSGTCYENRRARTRIQSHCLWLCPPSSTS